MKACCASIHDSSESLDDFFASGLEESVNPFLTADSRRWANNLSLKGALLATLFLIGSFIVSYYSYPLSRFLLVFVYFFAGTTALIKSLKDLQSLRINIDVLMTLAAFLSMLIGSEMEGGLLLVLFALSEAMEDTVTKRTKGALHALHKLSPKMAQVVSDKGIVFSKSVREVDLDEKLLIRAGEIIPLDGLVVEGSSYLNNMHLTGESIPIAKKIGDDVTAGSLNVDGTLTIRVTKTSAESTLAKIIKLVTEAQSAKPKLQRIFDRFGEYYSVTIILLALFFGLTLPFLQSIPYFGFEGSIYRALAFLIAASPCALIIATPTAYLSSISACAKKGILLKGGIVLDAIAKCKLFAFDKTGTLTTGNLKVASFEAYDGSTMSKEEALSIASALERAVVHPISDAIIRYAEKQGCSLAKMEDIKAIPGEGVQGLVEGKTIPAYIGNVDFIKRQLESKHHKIIESITKEITREGHLVTLLLIGTSIFAFHFLDELREDIPNFVSKLHEDLSIKVAMLTGDHKENADFVAKKLGIDEVYADLKPQDKLNVVSNLSEKTSLAMVGDGINDAPALTRATVGIAMGGIGSATAVEAADIVLLRDELSLISWLVKRSQKTMSIVKQNLSLALLVILVATTPSLLGYLPLWLAVIFHEGSTVVVALNSLRLLRK